MAHSALFRNPRSRAMSNLTRAHGGDQVSAVSFGMYSADAIRKMSVTTIQKPVAFDSLNHPVPGGLYDPAMGPIDFLGTCKTCNLMSKHCPGHCGHIELPLPVFNHVMFKQLLTIIKSCCWFCGELNCGPLLSHLFELQMELLDRGLIAAAQDIALVVDQLKADEFLSEVKQSRDELTQKIIQALDIKMEEYLQANPSAANVTQRQKSIHSVSLRNDIIAQLLVNCRPGAKTACWCCKMPPKQVKISPQGTGIFLMPTGPKSSDRTDAALQQAIRSRTSRFGTALFPLDEVLQVSIQALQDKSVDNDDDDNDGNKPKSKATVDSDDELSDPDSEPEEEEAEDEPEEQDSKPAKIQLTQIELQDFKKLTEALKIKTLVTPIRARKFIEAIVKLNQNVFTWMFWGLMPTQGAHQTRDISTLVDMFFQIVVPVVPNRFRPVARMGDMQFENAQTQQLTKVIGDCILLSSLRSDKEKAKKSAKEEITLIRRVNEAWQSLQLHVNIIYDNKGADRKNPEPGVRQVLEKKEGLFRMHMMGKRVNYSARSVISPDPMIGTNEIGVPTVFAVKLTYPEPVTPWNVHVLRKAVINGPEKHPGAASVMMEDGHVVVLGPNIESRIAIANQLLTPSTSSSSASNIGGCKKVMRHLINGDLLLVNRQPTLHKSSIMAHQARVLPGERTIRMHYANCKTYNADFDGDEMNLHLAQNEYGRSEALNIVLTDHQYFALDGNPLRGLIQDHICAAVLMTQRGTLFDREHYQQLVYNALPLEFQTSKLKTVTPCIIKPRELWSGKQIITTLLLNLTQGINQTDKEIGLNLTCKAKIKNTWSRGDSNLPGEDEFIVRQGRLLNGVLDKNQIGASAYGLVHACHEIYGDKMAGQLLTAMGLLCNAYMKYDALTMGVADILLKPPAEAKLLGMLEKAATAGPAEVKKFVDHDDKLHSPEDFKAKLESVYNDVTQHAALDSLIMGVNNKSQSKIIEEIMPQGLLRQFPKNFLQLMIQSGAKGSNVNATQISCLLGQQALEGRRVPKTAAYKTLPSFQAFDNSARSHGMVYDSFLRGVRPQDYFFHCMAGREGLIDTAVKTSRSGYLQRCLIKHLEDLRVNYDMTVRDADGSVVQFLYGEDGADITKTKQLENFSFLSENYENMLHRLRSDQLPEAFPEEYGYKARKHHTKAMKKPAKYDPALSVYRPDTYFGSVSEGLTKRLDEFIAKSPQLFKSTPHYKTPLTPERLVDLVCLKSCKTLADPGEPVGVIAAQAIGEPSTQMTLNTFHFAGHGEANVTLGIPRLREVLMVASKIIKTPLTSTSLLPGKGPLNSTDKLVKRLQNVLLKEILRGVEVNDEVVRSVGGSVVRRYKLKLFFAPIEELIEHYAMGKDELFDAISGRLTRHIIKLAETATKGTSSSQAVQKLLSNKMTMKKLDDLEEEKSKEDAAAQAVAQDDSDVESVGSSIDDDNDAEAGTTGAKAKRKHAEMRSYDNVDSDDEKANNGEDGENEGDDDKSNETASETEDDAPVVAAAPASTTKGGRTKESVIRYVTKQHGNVLSAYDYDDVHGRWCELTLEYPLSLRKVFFVSLIGELAPKFFVRRTPEITRCRLLKSNEALENPDRIQIEGDALSIIWKNAHIFDVNKASTNNIHQVLITYGVEAARALIIDQLRQVFDVYAIKVDHHHLSLIADYMTFEGGYKAMNRLSMNSNVSPFTQMSFETTGKFLEAAVARADFDPLDSHSSRIVMGRASRTGTGSCDMVVPMQ